jgi:hypothetical protein
LADVVGHFSGLAVSFLLKKFLIGLFGQFERFRGIFNPYVDVRQQKGDSLPVIFGFV